MTTADAGGQLEAEPAPPVHACLDCTRSVDSDFCPSCGQRQKLRPLSLHSLIWELLIEILDTDARVWRTLRTLVTQPGQLTLDWAVGRRTRHVPPFRLYLVLNVLVFLVFSLTTDTQFETAPVAPGESFADGEAAILAQLAELETREGPGVAGRRRGLEQALTAIRTVRARTGRTAGDAADREASPANASDEAVDAAGETPADATAAEARAEDIAAEVAAALDDAGIDAEFRLESPLAHDDDAEHDEGEQELRLLLGGFGINEASVTRAIEGIRENPAAFGARIYEQLPTVMILLLPLLALAMSGLYLFSGKPFVVHLVGLAHLHAFLFLLILLLEGFEGFGALLELFAVPWLPSLFSLLAAFGGTVGFWYVASWLKRLYGHGTGGAIAMSVVVLLLHFVGATLGIVAATLITFLGSVNA